MVRIGRPDQAFEQLRLLPAEVPMEGPWCQRWRPGQRRHTWRHRSEGGFDPSRYHVRPMEELAAADFCNQHHYIGSLPPTRLRYGMFEGQRLVGVAVLSVPMRPEVLTGVFPKLEPLDETLELGRFALLDSVQAPAESWFLARALRLAAHDGIRGVVSFADPVPQYSITGELICPGHAGIIYQAANAAKLGRSRARIQKVLPDGRVLSDRTVAKLIAGDRGHAYAERLLRSFGAPPRRPAESARAWLDRALPAAGVRLLRHPGKHRYALIAATSRAEARAIRAMLPASDPYPKQLDLR